LNTGIIKKPWEILHWTRNDKNERRLMIRQNRRHLKSQSEAEQLHSSTRMIIEERLGNESDSSNENVLVVNKALVDVMDGYNEASTTIILIKILMQTEYSRADKHNKTTKRITVVWSDIIMLIYSCY